VHVSSHLLDALCCRLREGGKEEGGRGGREGGREG